MACMLIGGRPHASAFLRLLTRAGLLMVNARCSSLVPFSLTCFACWCICIFLAFCASALFAGYICQIILIVMLSLQCFHCVLSIVLIKNHDNLCMLLRTMSIELISVAQFVEVVIGNWSKPSSSLGRLLCCSATRLEKRQKRWTNICNNPWLGLIQSSDMQFILWSWQGTNSGYGGGAHLSNCRVQKA